MAEQNRNQLLTILIALELALILSRIIGVFILPVYDDGLSRSGMHGILRMGWDSISAGRNGVGGDMPGIRIIRFMFYFVHYHCGAESLS